MPKDFLSEFDKIQTKTDRCSQLYWKMHNIVNLKQSNKTLLVKTNKTTSKKRQEILFTKNFLKIIQYAKAHLNYIIDNTYFLVQEMHSFKINSKHSERNRELVGNTETFQSTFISPILFSLFLKDIFLKKIQHLPTQKHSELHFS